MKLSLIGAAVLVGSVACSDIVFAQLSAAQSLFIGPSIRASGTGRSSVAAFWGEDSDYWTNPALLGYRRGLRYEHGKTQLVPDLADDVYFKTGRVTYGHSGVGLTFSGFPLGRNKLEYGETIETDMDGNAIGSSEPFEQYKYLGVGVSFAAVVDAVSDGTLGISRYGDIAAGLAHKRVELDLTRSWAHNGVGEQGDGTANDVGLLVRLTPLNSIDGGRSLLPVLDDPFRSIGGVRFDVSFARSTQNLADAELRFEGQAEKFAIDGLRNTGFGTHFAIGLPPAVESSLRDQDLGFLARAIAPIIDFGWSNQTIENRDIDEQDIENSGWELTLLNIFTFRQGDIDDPDGDIVGSTSGWGIGYTDPEFGGFQYDQAEVPQARGLDRVTRKGFSIFVYPDQLYRRFFANN